MIIDLILDRKDGIHSTIKNGQLIHYPEYNPKVFYDNVSRYDEIGWDILDALDGGTNDDIRRELCRYIIEHEYNPDICNYINSVNWI